MGKANILIIDDDEDIRDSVQVMLESQGYAVTTAANKEAGLAQVKGEKPDLIVLDVMMDGFSDGFELAREIKAEPDLKDTIILMMTAVTEKTGVEFKSSAGDPTWLPVDGYIDKPVEPDVLLAEIEKLLTKRS
jgi:CheY-like chemotaxis protein